VTLPVLLVHGIWDQGARFDRMRAGLERAGRGPVAALDLSPNDGTGTIEALASQVEVAAQALLEEARATQLDLVGFSMGALVSRYWVQRSGGKERARRFVSISGPHHGTLTAFAMAKAGVIQMRPESPLLADLERDRDPWGPVEVHTLWTPYDLMIVPAHSSQLRGVREDHRLTIALHRWMITHPRAIERVCSILRDT
jgi:triacylglycerol lipase